MGGFSNDPGTLQQEAGFGFDGRYWTESINPQITARAGGGQAQATLLDSMTNFVVTVASSGDSLQLPAARAGLTICSVNVGANAAQIFASNGSSDTINNIAGSIGVSQMPNSVAWFTCLQAANPVTGAGGRWFGQGLGSGFSASNQTYSFQDGMTANSAGTQTAGTVITTSVARFTTVAGAGYSGTLMPALPGLVITIINAGANIMSLYPASQTQGGASGGDKINTLGQNIQYSVPPGAVVDLYCTAAGIWHTLMQSTAAQQAYNTASNTTSFTATGAQITGATQEITLDLTGTIASNQTLTLPTVLALVPAMTVAGINPQPVMTYELDIIARSAANTWTVAGGTGWTLNGTMTIGTQMRKFYVTLTSLTTATLQSIGTLTIGAA